MSDFVEGLAEVHHQDISLMATVAVGHEVMVKFGQLSLAREHTPEAMLMGIKDVVLLCSPIMWWTITCSKSLQQTQVKLMGL